MRIASLGLGRRFLFRGGRQDRDAAALGTKPCFSGVGTGAQDDGFL